jgi:hypothetical protein
MINGKAKTNMKVWFKTTPEDLWMIGYLLEDHSFCGGWKINHGDGISVLSITLIEDFKMYKEK